MAKMTLLEMVQNILSALDSDEVTDINDTVESAQVAEIIKETYYEQFNNINIPSSTSLLKLDGISDTNSPNYMRFNSDVDNIKWIKYKDHRNQERFTEVGFITPEEFLDIVLQHSASTDNVFLTTDPSSTVTYYIKTNKCPTYYTSFDNNYIAFDSYDSDYDTTLHSNNSIAYGTKNREFTVDNGFIPDIPDNLFPLLLAEAKSVCFINLKQISSSKEEQRARRQRIRMQNDQHKSKDQQRRHIADAPNYARQRH
jgi:hypothetical protein